MTKYVLPALITSLAMSCACFADNPIVQTIYTADPAPMVYKDTLYVYTGHDEDGVTIFHHERLAGASRPRTW